MSHKNKKLITESFLEQLSLGHGAHETYRCFLSHYDKYDLIKVMEGICKTHPQFKKEISQLLKSLHFSAWSPHGNTLDAENLYFENQYLKNSYTKILNTLKQKLKTSYIINIFALLIAFGGLCFSFIFMTTATITIQNGDSEESVFFILVYCLLLIGPFLGGCAYGILYPSRIKKEIRDVEKDVINVAIAEQNDWIYDSRPSDHDYLMFGHTFSDILFFGEGRHIVQDQFYGKYLGNDFWSGVLEFSLPKGCREIRHLYAFRIANHVDMSIVPKNNFVPKNELQVESVDFNNTFSLIFHRNKKNTEIELVKTLSPAIQIRLIDFQKKYGRFAISLKRGVVLFAFEENFYKTRKTNFFKSEKVSPLDIAHFNSLTKDILTLSRIIVMTLN